MKKKTKPAPDQHIWKEVLIQPELFTPVIEIEGATEQELAVLKEIKLLIQQKLFDRIIELAFGNFTEHQVIVLALILFPDRTYNEVATMLNINYTAISHAIKGIKSNKHGKFHGGYEKKLRKICMKDDECLLYIDIIYKLRDNNPQYALELLKEYDDNPDFWNNFLLTQDVY